jgi:hypothetical protein
MSKMIDTSGNTLVNVTTSALPTGAATGAKQDTGNTSLGSIDTKLTSQATAAKQDAEAVLVGAVNESAPASDTASSGLNGRLQRVAQRLTSLIALLPAALGAGGGLKVDGSGTALPVSAASLPLPSGAATETTLASVLTQSDFDTKVGSLTEAAPASDTASSGVNGRLQRIAQRLTSLIALLPTSLGSGGGLKVDGSGTALPVTIGVSTSGGVSVAAGSIGATATAVKGSAGQVYGWYFYNANATVAYVQFFNVAAGSVTLGTTTPVYSLGIPAGSGANVAFPSGIPHSTAIAIAVTTTRTGSTGPGSTVDYAVFYN